MLTRRPDSKGVDLATATLSLDPSYRELVRRYRKRATEEHRLQWIDFYLGMEQLHTKLAAEHREKAQALMEEPRARASVCEKNGDGPFSESIQTASPDRRTICSKREESL